MRIQSQNSRGFSLLEIIVALSVAMLILGAASLTIGSVNQEHQLRRFAGGIETAARAAHLDAVTNQQTRVLMLDGKSIRDLKSGKELEVPKLELSIDSKWKTPRDIAWKFSPSGICEPISLRITSENGTLEMTFDPLTGEAADERVTILN